MAGYECPFCGKNQPGGYCRNCGEWFDSSQDATSDHYDSVPEPDPFHPPKRSGSKLRGMVSPKAKMGEALRPDPDGIDADRWRDARKDAKIDFPPEEYHPLPHEKKWDDIDRRAWDRQKSGKNEARKSYGMDDMTWDEWKAEYPDAAKALEKLAAEHGFDIAEYIDGMTFHSDGVMGSGGKGFAGKSMDKYNKHSKSFDELSPNDDDEGWHEPDDFGGMEEAHGENASKRDRPDSKSVKDKRSKKEPAPDFGEDPDKGMFFGSPDDSDDAAMFSQAKSQGDVMGFEDFTDDQGFGTITDPEGPDSEFKGARVHDYDPNDPDGHTGPSATGDQGFEYDYTGLEPGMGEWNPKGHRDAPGADVTFPGPADPEEFPDLYGGQDYWGRKQRKEYYPPERNDRKGLGDKE